VSRKGIGGFERSLQQQLGQALGGVGLGQALAGPVVELVGDRVELGFGDGGEVGALGKYWRSSPLVFSLEPRCHGACGSQKKTSMLASTWVCRRVAALGCIALILGSLAVTLSNS
jgi:hypothetical protein